MRQPRFAIRLGITAKLFLAILLSCITVALAMGMAVRVSFQAGFTHYLEERDTRRAALLSETLVEIYREQGNWDFLRDQPRQWWRILRASPRAGPMAGGNEGYTPPPPFYLIDANGQPIAGARADEHTISAGPRFALEVDGQTVGWLVRQPLAPTPDALDESFASQQRKATWIIGILSLILAAGVSILLARMFLAPLQRIGQATHDLAAGKYATRVAVDQRDELGKLAEDFNRLAMTLERNEQLRRDLMADISHDLRTPLAVLRGELEALQDGIRPYSAASLLSLQHEVNTLSQLINDLHELAMADAGALNYRMQRLDVATLLQRAVQAYTDRFHSRSLQVEWQAFKSPLWILGDEQRLDQLFHNVLENAVRYTDPGGQVQVLAQAQDGLARLTIRDSAPGVPTEILPRLFERLFRAEHSRNRDSGGSGLGLAISLRIVEAHGGHITAHPSPLGGIEIRIEIPMADE